MLRTLIACLIMLVSTTGLAANSPLGYWKTVDDVSGRVQSIVQIYMAPDHTLSGRVLKTFPKPGVEPLVKCNLCEGALHDQPIIGLTILSSLKPSENKNEWTEGRIVDPKTGKVYHCFVKLDDNGGKLTIRGYVVFHWLGRSQTWLRTNAP